MSYRCVTHVAGHDVVGEMMRSIWRGIHWTVDSIKFRGIDMLPTKGNSRANRGNSAIIYSISAMVDPIFADSFWLPRWPIHFRLHYILEISLLWLVKKCVKWSRELIGSIWRSWIAYLRNSKCHHRPRNGRQMVGYEVQGEPIFFFME